MPFVNLLCWPRELVSFISGIDRRFVDFVKHISSDDWMHICNQICNQLLLLYKLSIRFILF